ncbi:hypothetical protein ACS0Y6_32670, partial [Burkholderia gladioli]|uniref:hypothetical protein n=1 Tax=Burkholderia gladioli TaxID=28095 RepID=UPI003F78DAB0
TATKLRSSSGGKGRMAESGGAGQGRLAGASAASTRRQRRSPAWNEGRAAGRGSSLRQDGRARREIDRRGL